MLDIKVCACITSLVEKLATSGKQQIDKKVFKEFVSYAGQSEVYIKFSLERIFQHLEQKHSEIRLGTFLIIDALFKRSHYFREILLDDFHTFLELTVESNPSKLLPPPLSIAKSLKQTVLQAIHKWYSTFGDEHKRLALSYNFLKNNLKVDFQDALKRNANELNAERQERERQAKVIEKKVKAVETELNENQDEIIRVVCTMDNCFCLLIPKPEDSFGENQPDVDKDITPPEKINLREHGFSSTVSITVENVNFGKVIETEDNLPIIENLKDLNALLKNRFVPMIKKWVVTTSKSNDTTLFRKIMGLKTMLEKQIDRFNQVHVSPNAARNLQQSSSEEESDSDFEDVPEKEGFESEVVSPPVPSPQPHPNAAGSSKAYSAMSTGWRLWDVQKDDANDPTTLQATLKSLETKTLEQANYIQQKNCNDSLTIENHTVEPQTETRKRKLLKIAPKLPFDIDLYHWEDTDLKAPSVEIVETDGHKFWTPAQDRAGEVIDDPNGIASLRTRVIEFSGEFEPVKWSCRTPLPSGSLCPRRDRLKCPLHGKIIGRDNIGNPTNPEDIEALQKIKETTDKNKPPEWQDPEFLKEIQAATGMDLTIHPTKKGMKKKKTFAELYPGLTDVDKKRNNPRSRLEKKIFNKTSMKRVAETLDELNEKRFRDKFGDQWNYSMNGDNL